MIFKIQKLSSCVHVVRGYRKKEDIKYCSVCTLYRTKQGDSWNVLAAMTDGGNFKEVREVLNYFKNYPDGVYTYVTKRDWKRFYKRFCVKIKFDD